MCLLSEDGGGVNALGVCGCVVVVVSSKLEVCAGV